MQPTILKSELELHTYEKNISEMLLNRVEKFSENIVIQEKKDEGYYKLSWKQLYEKVKQIGLGLISSDINKGDKIAVLSRDCIEILAFELACMSIGCIFIPIYSGYYPKQIEYVISHSDPKFVVVSDDEQLGKILSTMATGNIEKYFLIDYSEKYFESTRIFDFKLLFKEDDDYTDFFERTKEIEPDDICLLLYTSGGSTGISKGVEISHENILGQQKSIQEIWDITEKDVLLSYFPWHHSSGIIEKFISLYSGACLTLDRTPGIHIDTLADNLRESKPTICFGDSKIFFELMYEAKLSKNLEEAFFHDQLRFVFSASNPSNEVIDYFASKNTPVLQGWGMTETLQYVTLSTLKDDWKKNTSGFPIPGVEIKLEGEDNEIFVRGINVIKNYYKDEERTNILFTEDNWFKTGDSGVFTDQGLKILGRIDSIFHLTNNEKVYASKLEHIIETSCIFISNSVVFGENQQFIGALIFPEIGNLMRWYEEKNGYTVPLIDALDEQEVIELYREKIRNINEKNLGFNNVIKYFTLMENAPSVKSGELSSSLSIVRRQVLENYKYLTEVFYLEDGFFPELKSRIIEV